MPTILAINGSPRLAGNTDLLLARAVEGARSAGCQVTGLELRSLHISPCLELYGCKNNGRCVIKDDFQQFYDLIPAAQAIMLASPIFFYTVSGQTKIFMDRCQSFWVKKNWLDNTPPGATDYSKKGLFLSVAASRGKRLFEGASLSVRYFFDALDTELCEELYFRGLDARGEALAHPDYLKTAYETGRRFGMSVKGS